MSNADDHRIYILREGNLSQWEQKSFVGNTFYTTVTQFDRQVVMAVSDTTASGLFYEHEIDLEKTPNLNWSWRIDNLIVGNNERDKNGDDYPARIYALVSGGVLFWKTRAINYVWSNNQAVETHWPNAYTGKARMLAVRSGSRHVGDWLSEKRNVREDFRRLFGQDVTKIHAIALMTDTDNTRQRATAYYGDIYFTAE